MLWLAIHMWALLFAAFAIGLGIGWWVWGANGRHDAPPSARSDTPIGTLDIDYEPAAEADGDKR
ncbi:MAG: hypothetical protein R3C58_04020 [Parvularculaceae bacterium]